MNTKSYQIAIFEKDTDKQVSFCEKTTAESPFYTAGAELEGYLDTICQSKLPGTTKEHFVIYVLTDNDNPFRVDFAVEYGTQKCKGKFQGTPRLNRTGMVPYQINWEPPEEIDTFPTDKFTSDGKRIFLDNFPQTERFGTYKAINDTFENRLRIRVNRRLNWQVQKGECYDDSDMPDLEPIDYVTRLAQQNNLESVVKWAIEDGDKRGELSSPKAIRHTIDVVNTGCSREISILRTIYQMEHKKAECLTIVAKAKAMLQEYDHCKPDLLNPSA
jgi:hypothetical protein